MTAYNLGILMVYLLKSECIILNLVTLIPVPKHTDILDFHSLQVLLLFSWSTFKEDNLQVN